MAAGDTTSKQECVSQNVRENNPSPDARYTMSPVESDTSDQTNRLSPEVFVPATTSPHTVHLLSSDDEDDDSDNEDDEEEDDDGSRTNPHSASHDTLANFFSGSARPTMSPTPGQAKGISSRLPSKYPMPKRSLPHDMLRGFPKIGDMVVLDIFNKHMLRAPGKSHYADDADSGEEEDNDIDSGNDGGPEGEFVGPGHATPPRHGDDGVRQVSGGFSEKQRKRAWTVVLREEQQLEEEEAAAARERKRREERRDKLGAAKRRFLSPD